MLRSQYTGKLVNRQRHMTPPLLGPWGIHSPAVLTYATVTAYGKPGFVGDLVIAGVSSRRGCAASCGPARIFVRSRLQRRSVATIQGTNLSLSRRKRVVQQYPVVRALPGEGLRTLALRCSYRRDAPREALQCGLRLRLASRQSPDLGAVATTPLLPLPPMFDAGRFWPRIRPNYAEAPYAVPASLLVAVFNKRLELPAIKLDRARLFAEVQFFQVATVDPVRIMAKSVWQHVAAHAVLKCIFSLAHTFRLSRAALHVSPLCNVFAYYPAYRGFVASNAARDSFAAKVCARE